MPETGAPSTARLRLRITTAAESQLRAGHPWLFADSIREQNREGRLGELAVIYDRKDKLLAVGMFDPESPIRLRVLQTGKPQTIDAVWWAARLDAAVARRDGLFDERTTGYRLVNGESDGWPGLVLDRYDATLVLKLYTAAWLPRLAEVVEQIRDHMQPERIVLRLSRNIQREVGRSRRKEAHSSSEWNQSLLTSAATKEWRDGQVILGPPLDGPVFFSETGLRFEADALRGQKTGFFLDQRENRRAVETLACDRTVLNAFSFSGGFSLYAARGGAESVTDLDISAHALAAARRNFALNQAEPAIARCRRELVQADAFEWLAGNMERKFDLIVLDPPSLAKRETERTGAIRAYGKLAESAIQHLSRGGTLLACSCSAHVSAEEFVDAVRAAASRLGRGFVELQTTRHAPDHPATFKEAAYLKAICLQF